MILISAPNITDIVSLRSPLQDAIRLELFTIPPYLTALYTLTGSSEDAKFARDVIRTVVKEEMLHMNLACNILNAIGGTPEINVTGTIPSYPNPLPMAIAGGLEVHLKRYSRVLIRDVFMEIEKPEIPLELPIKRFELALAVAGPKTIGEFYKGIRAAIVLLEQQGPTIFTGDQEKQVTGFFGDVDISVVDVQSAIQAIDTIVEQGEGTPQAPSDLQGDIAHFYRFQQLDKGMRIVPDEFSPFKYSFDPTQPISIDENNDVAPMVDDPQNFTFDASDRDAAALSDQCDARYSEILDTLQKGYTEDTTQLFGIDLTMDTFGNKIRELLQFELHGPHAGLRAGPRFKYVPKAA